MFKGTFPCLNPQQNIDNVFPSDAGSKFLDIREFYGDEDDLKPGKKGVSINQEQVRPAAAYIPFIPADFSIR